MSKRTAAGPNLTPVETVRASVDGHDAPAPTTVVAPAPATAAPATGAPAMAAPATVEPPAPGSPQHTAAGAGVAPIVASPTRGASTTKPGDFVIIPRGAGTPARTVAEFYTHESYITWTRSEWESKYVP